MKEYWKMDTETYQTIQKLKNYVSFIANQSETEEKAKDLASEIIQWLENVNQPQKVIYWSATIFLFNKENLEGYSEGIASREWKVSFEDDFLEIVLETNHSDFPQRHFGTDISYHANLLLTVNAVNGFQSNFSEPIELFINDAYQFRNYIDQNLNKIELLIDIKYIE